MIKNLSVKAEHLKLLKEDSGQFFNIEFGSDFLDLTPKTQAKKEKDSSKSKTFCASKDTYQLEKIFSNHDKGLTFRM